MSDADLLTVSQLAKKTGYSARTIYNLVSQGKIPYLKLSRGALRFDPAKIEQWIEDQDEIFRCEKGRQEGTAV